MWFVPLLPLEDGMDGVQGCPIRSNKHTLDSLASGAGGTFRLNYEAYGSDLHSFKETKGHALNVRHPWPITLLEPRASIHPTLARLEILYD